MGPSLDFSHPFVSRILSLLVSLGGFASCVFVALMACLFTVSLHVAATGLGVFISCLGFIPVQGAILSSWKTKTPVGSGCSRH